VIDQRQHGTACSDQFRRRRQDSQRQQKRDSDYVCQPNNRRWTNLWAANQADPG
jgi:hypothetical protein